MSDLLEPRRSPIVEEMIRAAKDADTIDTYELVRRLEACDVDGAVALLMKGLR
jgi:hypothetical protein